MIYEKQLVLHDPENGVWGDCFRACIASLLGKRTEEVPHFFHDGCDGFEGTKRLNQFLRPMGSCFIEFGSFDTDWFEKVAINTLHHTIIGDSPRFPGTQHCVVGRNGQVCWDPHPNPGPLSGELTFGFIIKVC